MFDVDHFKRINDVFGHPIGDRVLRTITDCRAVHLRPTDLIGRLGGEEFAILLPETPGPRRPCAAPSGCGARSRRPPPAIPRSASPPISAPAALDSQVKSVDQWIAEADLALRAKRERRNRYVPAGAPEVVAA